MAERTGIAAGTIRMWEQRYGFPVPQRTESGYRRYSEDDVETLRRVLALRHRGLSVPAAIARAQESGGPADRPSIYAAVASTDHGARPQTLRKSTLVALSRAIEHEALAQGASPVLIGAFQHEEFYREVEARYRRIARQADAACVFADFASVRREPGRPVEIPIGPDDALGNEWAVIVDAPGYAACLLAWEMPGVTEPGSPNDMSRRFDRCGRSTPSRPAARRRWPPGWPATGRVLRAAARGLLADRPLASEQPSPTLTALTNRLVAYLESAAG